MKSIEKSPEAADATCTNGVALDIISIAENISESSERSLASLIQ
ncbi:MAG: hypothetical protein AB9861_12130 [Methanosarcina sp.]